MYSGVCELTVYVSISILPPFLKERDFKIQITTKTPVKTLVVYFSSEFLWKFMNSLRSRMVL